MRIIAGHSRGRRLKTFSGRDVRPTSDRVREALFSSLGLKLKDARVLDLFAGTGALGLESLSRGASSAVFVEKSAAVQKMLTENIRTLDYGEKSRIVHGDAIAFLKRESETHASPVYDIIFVDPPYASDLLEKTVKILGGVDFLSKDGIVVAEHRTEHTPKPSGILRFSSAKRYGGTSLTFFQSREYSAVCSDE